jgi:hypothetical protein
MGCRSAGQEIVLLLGDPLGCVTSLSSTGLSQESLIHRDTGRHV